MGRPPCAPGGEGVGGGREWSGKASHPRLPPVIIRAVQDIRLAGTEQVRHTGHPSYPACSGTVSLVKHVDHMNPTPLYTQRADILRVMITSGDLQPRSPLPSESYPQQEHGV